MLIPSPKGSINSYYDYTFWDCMAGAKTNLPWKVSYPTQPDLENFPGVVFTPGSFETFPAFHTMKLRKFFDGIPMLIEESDYFSQQYWDDGAWATWDEFNTMRHHYKASIAYLDGSVGIFVSPHGPAGNLATAKDLRCWNLLLHVGSATYEADDDMCRMGWANDPTQPQTVDANDP